MRIVYGLLFLVYCSLDLAVFMIYEPHLCPAIEEFNNNQDLQKFNNKKR